MSTERPASPPSVLPRIALVLVVLGAGLAAVAPACATSNGGEGSLDDSCNEDDVCDDDEDCDCVDCESQASCNGGTCNDNGVCDGDEGCDCADCAGASFCSGTGGSGATSSTNATTATSSATGGPGFVCADVSDTTVCLGSNQAACLCLGCTLPQCDDGAGGYNDCVCPDCADDPFCADPANCMDDGECHPGLEGCICADCAGHPMCL